MMISPELFYRENYQGRSEQEIRSAIRGLKNKMGRMKNILESPEEEPEDGDLLISPDLYTRISMTRKYIAEGRRALLEMGGEYALSMREREAEDFQNRIGDIKEIEFVTAGYFCGHIRYVIEFDGSRVIGRKHFLYGDRACECFVHSLRRHEFLEEFGELHIGEWKKNYNLNKYGIMVCDGMTWELTVRYKDGAECRFKGDNAYPYNYDDFYELFFGCFGEDDR